MKKFIMNVEGIKCGGCASKIKNILSQQKSVTDFDVSVENKMVTISGADDLSGMSLKKSIEELGFSVVGMQKEG